MTELEAREFEVNNNNLDVISDEDLMFVERIMEQDFNDKKEFSLTAYSEVVRELTLRES